jgi:hypothetical protein
VYLDNSALFEEPDFRRKVADNMNCHMGRFGCRRETICKQDKDKRGKEDWVHGYRCPIAKRIRAKANLLLKRRISAGIRGVLGKFFFWKAN